MSRRPTHLIGRYPQHKQILVLGSMNDSNSAPSTLWPSPVTAFVLFFPSATLLSPYQINSARPPSLPDIFSPTYVEGLFFAQCWNDNTVMLKYRKETNFFGQSWNDNMVMEKCRKEANNLSINTSPSRQYGKEANDEYFNADYLSQWKVTWVGKYRCLD